MSKQNYISGMKINTIVDFANSDSNRFFWMNTDRVYNRAFLEQWQYAFLKKQIEQGRVFEAGIITEDESDERND